MDGLTKNADGTYDLFWLGGTKELKPVKYFIRAVTEEYIYWWFFTGTETAYYVNTEYMRIGPFDSKEECYSHLTSAGVSWRDIEIIENVK